MQHPSFFTRTTLWGIVAGTSLILIWPCLDRYLAPRFLWLSIALLFTFIWGRKFFIEQGIQHLLLPDIALLIWYGINFAGVWHGLSFSEGIFYAQKSLLLFAAYWYFRQIWTIAPDIADKTSGMVMTLLVWINAIVLFTQMGQAFLAKGLDNDTLYIYATGISGNKGLASDLLFLLLGLHFVFPPPRQWIKWFNISLLLMLILLLQTRTVYVATAIGSLFLIARQWKRPSALPNRLAGAAILMLLLAASYNRMSKTHPDFARRLNPLEWLDSASANERRFVWYKTDLLCKDHFWTGVGNGNWKIWLPSKSLEGAYRLQEKNIVFTRAHNDYLEIRAELGILGALWFILIFVLAAISLYHGKQPYTKWALAGTLSGYCIIQYFDFPRERPEMQLLLAWLLALSTHSGAAFWRRMPGYTCSATWKTLFWGGLILLLSWNIWIGIQRVNGEIHTVKAMNAYQKQQYPVVVREIQKAKNAYWEYNDVVVPLDWYEGMARYKMNQPEASLKALERAILLNPWQFQVINNYASALATAHRYPEAIQYFQQAVFINPKYDEGKFNLAWCYMQQDNWEAALDWVQKADTIPHPKTSDEILKNKAILNTKAQYEEMIAQKKKQ